MIDTPIPFEEEYPEEAGVLYHIYENRQDNLLNAKVEQVIRKEPKIGRNSPCPCGSGKKYKKCCLVA